MNIKSSIQMARAYRRDPLGYVRHLIQTHGSRVVVDIFGRKLIVLTNPADVLHVLKENNASYTKGRTTKKLIKFMGKGLITNEGDDWRRQHRLIRPVMNLKSVLETGPKMQQTVLEFVKKLDISKEVNVFYELNRLTWRIVLNTLFTQEATAEMDGWLEDVLYLMESITKKTRTLLPVPFWIPTPDNVRFKKVIKRFDDYVYKIIAERRSGERKKDLLQLLIDAQDEGTTNGMSDLQIKDEIMTFLLAGHETITNSMSWTLITLAQNKQYLEGLKQESKVFFEHQNYEELNSMPLLSAVMDEMFRLWPPVWVFMRQAEAEDKMDGLTIPKKANVIVSPFFTQRSPDLWDKPETFSPERFFSEPKKKIIPGAYFPFGLGPRACIGAYFASLEAKIILANFIQHFEWDFVNQEVQTHEAGITLRPTNNILMKFRRR